MNFQSLRRYLTALLVAFGAAAVLSSCGGGGGSSNLQGGPVHISPSTGTFYAGIPMTFLLQGGRPPYALTSSEPSLLPIPSVVRGNSVTVVPNNPGVIDADLQPGELPVRTVEVTMRDSTGFLVRAEVQIAQNFLTGYGLSITPTTCPAASSSAFDPGTQACAGGESAVRLQATFAGNLFGNQAFRLQVLRGNFALRDPATGQVSSALLLNSDHSGTVTGIITVPAGVPTQLAVLRVIHVPSGVYADHVFTISRGAATAGQLVAIPDDFTFTGPLTTVCGTGTAEFFVFDGVPPYTAVSSSPHITVTSSSGGQPGRFTIRADNPNVCVEDITIIVTDSLGGRDTVTVTTETGDTEPAEPPPVPDLVVGPTSLTLGCDQSGSVTVAGGTGNYSVNSTNPEVFARVFGNTVTITRLGPAGPGSGTLSSTISITDGTDIVTVSVASPAVCP